MNASRGVGGRSELLEEWTPAPPDRHLELLAEHPLHLTGQANPTPVVIVRHGVSCSTSSQKRHKHIHRQCFSTAPNTREWQIEGDADGKIRGSLTLCVCVSVWTFGDGKNSFLWSWSTQTHENYVIPGLFSQVLRLLPIQKPVPLSELPLGNVLLCTCTPLTQYFISHSLLLWRLPNYITIHIWCWFINESLKWMGVLAVNTNFHPCLSPLASLQTSDENLEGHFLFYYQILSFSARSLWKLTKNMTFIKV